MHNKNTAKALGCHKDVIIYIIKCIISYYNLQFLTDKLRTGPLRLKSSIFPFWSTWTFFLQLRKKWYSDG